MNTDAAPLLPCPFCRKAGIRVEGAAIPWRIEHADGCYFSGKLWVPDSHIEAWNRRAPVSDSALKEAPFKLPVRIEHATYPIGDTGDHDCVTRLVDRTGETLCDWWDTSDEEEAQANAICDAINAHWRTK